MNNNQKEGEELFNEIKRYRPDVQKSTYFNEETQEWQLDDLKEDLPLSQKMPSDHHENKNDDDNHNHNRVYPSSVEGDENENLLHLSDVQSPNYKQSYVDITHNRIC